MHKSVSQTACLETSPAIRPHIAVIGSGISGLYAAYRLAANAQITLFEQDSRFGGHTDTHDVPDGTGSAGTLAVDSGFIVFNRHNYPLFYQMLTELGVGVQASDMSFSVADHVHRLTYNPSSTASLLSRPVNLLRRDFRQMLRDLLRFYRTHRLQQPDGIDLGITLDAYLNEQGYSRAFRQLHLYPMCGALWSVESGRIGELPLRFVIQFMQHHRMLQRHDRPQWLTVRGGSSQYIQAIQQQTGSRIQWQHARVVAVRPATDGQLPALRTAQDQHLDQWQAFDQIILAGHADAMLQVLEQPCVAQQSVLSAFGYDDNIMVLHQDAQLMPDSRSQWASWHVRVDGDRKRPHYSYTYWMNRLQNLPTRKPWLATLNPPPDFDLRSRFVTRHYRHPRYTVAAQQAQSRWDQVNGQGQLWFCGAYWGWGFHEDGARSAQRVVDAIRQHYGWSR